MNDKKNKIDATAHNSSAANCYARWVDVCSSILLLICAVVCGYFALKLQDINAKSALLLIITGWCFRSSALKKKSA